MRFLLVTTLTLVCVGLARADETPVWKGVKASLVFHDEFDATGQYPHLLKVFLRLDNANGSGISWVTDTVDGIEAELLDATNRPAVMPASVASIQHGSSGYFLPYGSRLDWLISHGGISMMGDVKNSYALMIGGHGWLIPISTAGSYTLRVRLRGQPRPRLTDHTSTLPAILLLDLPPAKVEVTP